MQMEQERRLRGFLAGDAEDALNPLLLKPPHKVVGPLDLTLQPLSPKQVGWQR
ncbi:hypothetical protein ACVJMZ_000037 [Sinorhizobium medicae]